MSMPTYGAATTSGACGVKVSLNDPTTYSSLIEGLEDVTQKAQQHIEQCGCASQACVANVLDKYADAIEKVTKLPRSEIRELPHEQRSLPSAIRDLPRLVREAAKRVRAAPTVKAAVRAVEAVIVLVHKTIELARAPDPDSKSVATRGGELVADTLKTAADALARPQSL